MPNANMSPPMFWKNSSIFTLKDEETEEESKAADAADDPDDQVETIFFDNKEVVGRCSDLLQGHQTLNHHARFNTDHRITDHVR